MKTAKTDSQLKRERLKELTSSPSWQILEGWVRDRVVELYKRLEACSGEDCTRTQGSLAAYKRLLDLKKSLRSDEVVRQSLDEEE